MERILFFWTDGWLHGQRLDQVVPYLFGVVSNGARKRTVHEALTDMRWVTNIQGVLTEYLRPWDLLSHVDLQPDVEDHHIWQFLSSRKYLAKSAYETMFIGATSSRPWERVWKS